MNELPRVSLTAGATPLQALAGLSARLGGPRLLVKRDDLTPLALGGNKTRKLEYLLADALECGADTLVTTGGVQSNHCRLTAAAAALHGLDCELVLGAEPQAGPWNGNLLLDHLFGAVVHWSERTARESVMAEVAARLRDQGRHPYVIPLGGSNGLGAVGYVRAMHELADQLRQSGDCVDHIVVASSSGGTQAGMTLGTRLTGFEGRLIGISIDQHERGAGFPQQLSAIADDAAERMGLDERFGPEDFDLDYRYLGGGYGVVGDLEREAVILAATCDGLLVGPVYTARALGGMIDMVRRGEFSASETLLFWHTGDTPALFAYGQEFA